MFGFTKQITAVLASIFVIGLFFASPAAAEKGPIFLPGGNGPDEPLVFNPDLVIAPLTPSASVAASCNSESGTVTVSNPTNNVYALKVIVDGVQIATTIVSPNNQYKKSFPLAENATKAVKVTRASVTMLDTDVKRDCLKPAPAYDVLTNCDTEQAHARLINNGDDTAMMAIQYGEGAYAHQPVAAHSSKDWLLTVSPNESVSFNVVHSSTILGSEDLLFDCPVEVPEVEVPEVKKPEVETPEVETPETTGSAIEDGDDEQSGPKDENDSDSEEVDTEVLGTVEELALADITEIGTTGDIDEIVGEVAGPTMASVDTKSGMSVMKMALIGIWLLVLVAAGLVGVLVNRRRAQAS